MPSSHHTTTRRPPLTEPSSAARPRTRTQRRPRPTPAVHTRPDGDPGQCHCHGHWPVLHVDFTRPPPAAHLRHNPAQCGLPNSPYTLRNAR
jgi:hypothetical protein